MLSGCQQIMPADTGSSSESTEKDTADAGQETAGEPENVPGSEKAPEEESPEADHASVEEGPIDMEAFLTELAKDHPDSGAEELCQAMTESPYFRLFSVQETEYVYPESTEHYYPGLNYEYTPEGISEAYCVIDYISGSGALVYAIIPEEGTDAEALGEEFAENMDPHWMAWEEDSKLVPDQLVSKAVDGKLFVAMYQSDMKPVNGPVAEKTRDLAELFRSYLEEEPEASCLEIMEYLNARQKISQMMVYEVSEGQLTGFGSFEAPAEITGFSEGAILQPMMSPNTNIAYVFRAAEGTDPAAFEDMLKEKADLAWNVCMAADTVITEREGDLVLFMMCSENAEY